MDNQGIKMHVVMGADHAGYLLKSNIAEFLTELGYEFEDVGTCDETPVDYPDIAVLLSRAIIDGRAERGILICGSGVGASIAANKIRGIRAGLCHDTYSAHQGVEHDDTNVLVLGSRIIGTELARELVRAFLAARFTNEERHLRRVGKVIALEERSQA
jgi:RpiB/LacA/LacB family sugar-phosphate isomerase